MRVVQKFDKKHNGFMFSRSDEDHLARTRTKVREIHPKG